MERDSLGRLVLVDETDALNTWEILPNSEDPEEQDLFELVSGEVHEFPLVLNAIQSEILMNRIQEILDDHTEIPSIRESAQELLDSLN